MKTTAELNALPDGVYSLSREEYDRLDRANFSTLKLFEKSPAHYRHNLTARDEDTDAKQRGRAVAMAVYEPERFRSECVVWDGKTRRGEEWEAFVDRHPDQEVLTKGMHAAAVAIGGAARACAMAAPYLSGGKGEQTLLWTHKVPALAGLPGYEIRCKGRLDFIANVGAIVDLKNTRNAHPEGFGREVMSFLSHVQAAFYVDGYRAATGRELPYVIIAVEPKAPFVCQVFEVPAEILELGREKYRTWLDRLNVCRETSEWPGYAAGPVALTLPKWAVPQDDEDVTGLGLDIG